MNVHLRRCIICKQQVTTIFGSPTQPEGGTAFETHGHYGSTAFDPMDGSELSIVICDPCLHAEAAEVMHKTEEGQPWTPWELADSAREWVHEQAQITTVSTGVERELPDGGTVLVTGSAESGVSVHAVHDGVERVVRVGDSFGVWRVTGICFEFSVPGSHVKVAPTVALSRSE